MSAVTREQLLAVIAEARSTMEELAKMLPEAFDANGRAIEATLTYPRLPSDTKEAP